MSDAIETGSRIEKRGKTGGRVSVAEGRLDGLKLHCLPFRSPTPQSQFTGISSYYRFRWHHPLITQLTVS